MDADADNRRLIRYLLDHGASGGEVDEAARTGTLGPLGLELAIREPGENVPFRDAAVHIGLEAADAAALWRALGFPDPLRSNIAIAPSQVATLRMLAEMRRSELGEETTLQLARVTGGSMAQLAEAIVDAFRVEVEMPRSSSGEPYSQIVEDYARAAGTMFPMLAEMVADVLRTHILAVARSTWTPDEDRSTVTRERAVGFVDLVDYTRRASTLSPAGLAAVIARFESQVAGVVAGADGRLVKLIGDEAMFVAEDAATGCEIAATLMRTLGRDAELPSVRIGLAFGPVVAHHGDYYGDVVNLAARLVEAAEPGQTLVSSAVADAVPDGLRTEAVGLVAAKGYEPGVEAFRLNPP